MLGDLQHVKPELRPDMGRRIFGVGDPVAEARAKFGKGLGHGGIHGRMSAVIGGIMRQSSQSEGQLIQVLRIGDQFGNEIPAPDIMHQVAEELAAKRIVAHVLNQAAAISIGMGVAEVFRARCWITFQQKALDPRVP